MNMSSMDHLILVLLSMVVAFIPRFIPLRIFRHVRSHGGSMNG